mmetsp:Transcript_20001/g.59872  ORF Transcript_20001/g.59872 Transcript_20001/m.59872 type:complete len:606 (+) Transcript_20001:1648-3465(+)
MILGEADRGLDARFQIVEQVADVAQERRLPLQMGLRKHRGPETACVREPAGVQRHAPRLGVLVGVIEAVVELGDLVQSIVGDVRRDERSFRAVHLLDLGVTQLAPGVQRGVALEGPVHRMDGDGRRAARQAPGARPHGAGRRDGRGEARRHQIVGELHDSHGALCVGLDLHWLRPDRVIQVVDAHRRHGRRRELHLHICCELARALICHLYLGREALDFPRILRRNRGRQEQVALRPKPSPGGLGDLDEVGAGVREERVRQVLAVDVRGNGVDLRINRQRDTPLGLVQDRVAVARQIEHLVAAVEGPHRDFTGLLHGEHRADAIQERRVLHHRDAHRLVVLVVGCEIVQGSPGRHVQVRRIVPCAAVSASDAIGHLPAGKLQPRGQRWGPCVPNVVHRCVNQLGFVVHLSRRVDAVNVLVSFPPEAGHVCGRLEIGRRGVLDPSVLGAWRAHLDPIALEERLGCVRVAEHIDYNHLAICCLGQHHAGDMERTWGNVRLALVVDGVVGSGHPRDILGPIQITIRVAEAQEQVRHAACLDHHGDADRPLRAPAGHLGDSEGAHFGLAALEDLSDQRRRQIADGPTVLRLPSLLHHDVQVALGADGEQ